MKWRLKAGFENAGLMQLPQEGTHVYDTLRYAV